MTIAEIPLASGLRRLVDSYFELVRSALARFRHGGDYANAPACLSLPLLRRLEKLLRLALLIAATQLEIKPTQIRPSRKGVRRTRRLVLRAPGFRVFPVYRGLIDTDAPRGPAPDGFGKAERDPLRTIQRKLDALRRAFHDPVPLVRRMARRLPRQLKVFGWRPPRRPPTRIDRDLSDSLCEGYREARFQLGDYFRRRREREALASAT